MFCCAAGEQHIYCSSTKLTLPQGHDRHLTRDGILILALEWVWLVLLSTAVNAESFSSNHQKKQNKIRVGHVPERKRVQQSHLHPSRESDAKSIQGRVPPERYPAIGTCSDQLAFHDDRPVVCLGILVFHTRTWMSRARRCSLRRELATRGMGGSLQALLYLAEVSDTVVLLWIYL